MLGIGNGTNFDVAKQLVSLWEYDTKRIASLAVDLCKLKELLATKSCQNSEFDMEFDYACMYAAIYV